MVILNIKVYFYITKYFSIKKLYFIILIWFVVQLKSLNVMSKYQIS